jgi:NAD(P)-dependent dehydrogenase (short-subunit alcohol dehydrogenase family)
MNVVLITGCSTGIGQATAAAAARAGFQVVATVRDPATAGALRAVAPGADVRRLDVVDAESVRGCVDGVIADHGRLDAVVNNAGAGHVGTVEIDSMDTIRSVMEVNYFGVVAVTKAAMPHLRAAKGRLITVTSVGGAVGQPFNESYCAAKFAAEGMMESLAPLARRVGVSVSVVEPGGVATAFVDNVRASNPPVLTAAAPYDALFEAYMARTMAAFDDAQTPDGVAEVILRALTDDEPRFRYQTSAVAERFVGAKYSDVDGSAVQEVMSGWL